MPGSFIEFLNSPDAVAEKNRILFENAPIGIKLVDKNGIIVDCNDVLLRVLGRKREQVVGRHITDLLDKKYGKLMRGKFEELRKNHCVECEFEITSESGERFSVDCQGHAIYDDEKQFNGGVFFSKDIRERIGIQSALIESERRFREHLENVKLAAVSLDLEGNVTFCNDFLLDLTGYERSEVIGKNWYNLFVTDTEAGLARYAEHVDKADISTSTINSIRTRTGENRLIEWNDTILKDLSGKKCGITSIGIDITEKTLSENALKESEERFRKLIEESPEPIILHSDYQIEFANEEALKILGADSDEQIKGIPVIDIIHTEFKQAALNRIQRLYEEDHSIQREENLLRKFNGETLPVEVTTASVHYRGKTGAMAFLHDITERKRTERIQQARLHLSEFANDHTLDELLQESLDQVELITNSKVGFFHFIDEDKKNITLHAWSTRTLKSQVSKIKFEREFEFEKAGVWIDCLSTRDAVIHNDYKSLPHKKGYPEGHIKIIRMMTIPVVRGDRIVAIIGLGNKETDYDSDDIEATSRLAHLVWEIVERKRAEDALKANEEFSRSIVDFSPIGISVHARSGKLLGYNQAWRRIWAWDDKEMAQRLSTPSSEINTELPTGYLGIWYERVNEIFLNGGNLFVPEIRLTDRKEKGAEWITQYFYAIKNEADVVDRVVILTQDISDKKRTETALKASEEFSRSIVDYSPIGISVTTQSGLLLDYNDAWRKIWAWTDEELKLRKIKAATDFAGDVSVFYLGDMRDEVDKIFRQGGNLYIPEIHLESRREGRAEWIAQHFYAVKDDNGKVERVVVLTQDITKKKRDELELIKKDVLLQAVERISNLLLAESNIDVAIPQSLEILGQTADVDRVYVLRNHEDPDTKELLMSPVYEWNNGQVCSGIDNPSTKNVPYALGKDELFEKLSNRQVIYKYIDEISEHLRKLLSSMDVTTILLVPIHIKDEFWGVIGFDECKEKRTWTESEISLLQAAAASIGSAVDRKRTEEALVNSETLMSSILSASPVAIGIVYDRICGWVNERMVQMTGYTREELYGQSARMLYESDEEFERVGRVKYSQMREQGSGTIESCWVRKDGSIVDVLLSSAAVDPDDWSKGLIFTAIDITDKLAAEKAFVIADERVRTFIESAEDMIYFLSANGEISIMNDACVKVSGYTHKEISDDPRIWKKIIHPDDVVFERYLRREHPNGLPSYETQYRIKHKQGHWIYLHSKMIGRWDESGKFLGYNCIDRDITNLSLAQEQLRKLIRAVEQSPSTIVITDVNGNIEYVNPAFTKITGYTTTEAFGQNPRILKSGYHDESFYKELWGQISSGNTWHGELCNNKKDGSMYWESASISPVFDEKGQITHFLAVKEDITEQKLIQESLRLSEEKYRRFFESDLTGDFVESLDGTILSCNNEFAKIFGFTSANDAIGVNIRTLYKDLIAKDTANEELLQSGTLERYEIEMKRLDGAPLSVITNKVAHFDENGEVVEIFGYLFDITEQRMLEEQLRQSQKLEAVGRLAGGIAHDFNNILTGILGYTDLIEEEVSDLPNVQNDVKEIRKAATRAAELTSRLLAFSRRQVIAPEQCELNSMITNMADFLKRIIGENIELEIVLAPDLKPIWADPGQIEQVIMNLVVNSRDAMSGGGKLTITTSNISIDEDFCTFYPWGKPGEYSCLCVKDTGQGIPPEAMEHIFEPFFTTKEVGKGTGLGLSTVYGIIKQHNGMVIVDSEVGHGTSIVAYIPVTQSMSPIQIYEDDMVVSGGVETILIVEDEDMVRALAKRILEKAGYRVFLARTGVEAVEIYKKFGNEINLTISDIVMPQMGGIRAFRQIRDIDPFAKVIFASGYSDDSGAIDGADEMADGFVSKPFVPNDLLAKIREVLDRK